MRIDKLWGKFKQGLLVAPLNFGFHRFKDIEVNLIGFAKGDGVSPVQN